MSVTVKVDLSEFRRAVHQHAKVDTKRTLAEVINHNCYSAGIAAAKMTYKADKDKIAADMGREAVAVSQNVRFLKSGAVKRGKVNKATKYAPLVAILVNWRRAQRGLPGVKRDEMDAAMHREYLRRVRAIGYLRSGWLASIARFAAALGKPSKLRDTNRGDGDIARPSIAPNASFWNTAFSQDTKNANSPQYAAEGLQAAIQQQIGRMRNWAAGHLQRRADRLAGRMLR